jgi:hypothetical protein
MACEICRKFPVPTSKFELIDESIERHGTLYRCRGCGDFFEVIAEERSPRFTARGILERHYRVIRKPEHRF